MKILITMMTVLMIASGSATMADGVDSEKKWAGVDETVVQAFAKEAGMPARDPYINTDQGDLLLFLFLIAGLIGGFIMGYCYQQLFAPADLQKSKAE